MRSTATPTGLYISQIFRVRAYLQIGLSVVQRVVVDVVYHQTLRALRDNPVHAKLYRTRSVTVIVSLHIVVVPVFGGVPFPLRQPIEIDVVDYGLLALG
jgi:hypothetical protein